VAWPLLLRKSSVVLVRSLVCCRRYAIGLAAAAGLALVGVVALTMSAQTHESSTLVVSEVYGIGENASAALWCLRVCFPCNMCRASAAGGYRAIQVFLICAPVLVDGLPMR
jgi:hypothetical protein